MPMPNELLDLVRNAGKTNDDPTTSSTFGPGGNLNTMVQREAFQLPTYLDELGKAMPRGGSARSQAVAYAPREMKRHRLEKRGPSQLNLSGGPPQSSMMMDKYGRWSDWIDPNAAELHNTGRVLPGRTARGPMQKDDYNVSSGSHPPVDFSNPNRRAKEDQADFAGMKEK